MRSRDRGATLVEYALIIALLVVVLIGAIQRFEGNAEDRYDERAGQGAPAEEFGRLGPDGGTGTDPGEGEEPGGTVASLVVEPLTATAPASNNTWSMTVTVRVLGDGVPLGGVTFTSPTWTPSSGGTSSCTTTSTGICTYTQSMSRSGSDPVLQATFNLGTPSYTNPDDTSPTITIDGSGAITCTRPENASGSGVCG
jgi:Flp pilus assembly pilin Flp